MKPWQQVSVPQISGKVPAPKVFDSKTQKIQELRIAPDIKIYVCGITPYDATHMGHAATYVFFDTLIRVWQAAGAQVTYVQNVTDVDDPLIERAKLLQKDWQAIAVEQTELFKHDMEALRVIAPDHYIGAVESIPLVVKQIEKLRQQDAVYEIGGDLYYPIAKSELIGSIGHFSKDQMIEIFSERGGDPNRIGKLNPLDALLWKHERPDDPSWDTPLGKGRPGWHIECAAIALQYLGNTIDVQGGGSDLKFPHHEMSAAHAQTASGQTFARAYLHTGMVALDGQKMSKSLGNLVFVSKLRAAGVDPMAIRLAILRNHYRTDWEWFQEHLDQASVQLNNWRAAFESEKGAPEVTAQVAQLLADDLNTPAALELIDNWVEQTLAGHGSDDDSPKQMSVLIDALLGVY